MAAALIGIATFLPIWLLGSATLRTICGAIPLPNRALRFGVAWLLGVACCGLITFGIANVAPLTRAAVLAVEGPLTVFAWLASRRMRLPTPEPAPHRFARRLVFVVSGVAGVTFFLAVLERPQGDTDAMAMWNLRALFLVRGAGDWSVFARPEIAHGEYPPLVSLLVARAWLLAGSEAAWLPAALAGGFAIATGAIVYGTLRATRGPVLAAGGLAALVGAPAFVRHAASQSADVPVAAFLVASLAVAQQSGARRRVLMGALLGAAAFTKNEGIAMLVVATLVELAIATPRRIARCGALLCGAALPLVALLRFRLALGVGTDLVELQSCAGVLDNLCEPTRTLRVLGEWLRRCVFFGDFDSLVGTSPFLLALVRTFVGGGAPSPAGAPNTLVVAALGFVYGLVFVLTPRDQEWHIATAMTRTMFQLWPAFVVTCMGSLRAPA